MSDPRPDSALPRDGHVFIVTYGRSGSTVLQNLLNHLPGYCIRGENDNTLSHLARGWHMVERAGVMRFLRRQGQPTRPGHPWYGAEGIDPDRYGQALADGFVREILRPPPGTRVAGFKEIRFHNEAWFFGRYMEFLRRYFPRARFVFNTRDHAAVARSGWWARQDPAQVSGILTRAEHLYDDHVRAFPDCSLRLHYDDYNGNPEALRPLFAFLGEPFDAALAARVLAQRLTHLHRPGQPADAPPGAGGPC